MNLRDLKAYHNTKNNYEEDNTIRIPSDCKCNPKKINNFEYLQSVVNKDSRSKSHQSYMKYDSRMSDQSSFGDSDQIDDDEDSYVEQKPALIPAVLQDYHSIKTDGEDIFEDSCVVADINNYRRNTKFINAISKGPDV